MQFVNLIADYKHTKYISSPVLWYLYKEVKTCLNSLTDLATESANHSSTMTTLSQFNSHLLPILISVAAQLILAAMAGQEQQIALPDCPYKCGNITIPFPFGMKPGCFREGFEVTCNTSSHPPTAFLASEKIFYDMSEGPEVGRLIEIIEISLVDSEARVYGAVAYDCYTNSTHRTTTGYISMSFSDESPFLFSPKRNVLIGVGNSVQAAMESTFVGESSTISCFSNGGPRLSYVYLINGSCMGWGCCKVDLPDQETNMNIVGLYLERDAEKNYTWETTPCVYGMAVQDSVYNFSTLDLMGYKVLPNKFPSGVPMVLDFAIREGSCPTPGHLQPPPDYACLSINSYCTNVTGRRGGYVCKCAEHYAGNPYIPDGCQDINECELREQNPELSGVYPCSSNGICKNRLEGYDCPCKFGMKGDGKAGTCTDEFPLAAKMIVGTLGGIFLMVVLSFVLLLGKEKRKTREFYEKNGGLTLEKAKVIKLFKKEELNPIIKSGNFIGKGSFGKVYKGVLGDELVAVKKPINGSVLEKEQFANEVIIQSQVIHRNIVRLIGCCLEVQTPMLVYEFLSQGSLHDVLHDNNKNQPLNMDLRLTIAAESADGLAYMHSKTNHKILHGDVKPANVLLDGNFRPKISDFGISRLIVRDGQHTGSVIGDMSYMDPVYLQTGLLTEKSDVYSFGVMLLELISRKKATHSDNNSLLRNFLEAHKKDMSLNELFDQDIVETTNLELLASLAGIVAECLNLDVDQRPEMTEIAERLLTLSRSRKS